MARSFGKGEVITDRTEKKRGTRAVSGDGKMEKESKLLMRADCQSASDKNKVLTFTGGGKKKTMSNPEKRRGRYLCGGDGEEENASPVEGKNSGAHSGEGGGGLTITA